MSNFLGSGVSFRGESVYGKKEDTHTDGTLGLEHSRLSFGGPIYALYAIPASCTVFYKSCFSLDVIAVKRTTTGAIADQFVAKSAFSRTLTYELLGF